MSNDANQELPAPSAAADPNKPLGAAERNWRRFVLFRVCFNSRFYYPVLAVFFLDLGLSPTQYTLLNFAWAIAIVLTDVPAGVLADRIGRKPLIVGAAFCMVAEMLLLLAAPLNGRATLFLFCLANRVLSGVAEGMASGADEALVFDSLAERGQSEQWPKVLDQVMRWQSVGMVIAMLLGGAAYDPHFMNFLGGVVGLPLHLVQATTLRFPIYLNLLTAVGAVWIVLGFREPVLKRPHSAFAAPGQAESASSAWSLLLTAAKWIFQTPAASFILIGGLLIDSSARLLLTFSSSYFRLISLPAASFGLLGAGMAGLGFFAAPLARKMVGSYTLATNYKLIALATIGALVGIALKWPIWGAIFIAPLGTAMFALGFMVSYYINAIVESGHRATVLSFKGLAFNLGYGFMGLLFAGMMKAFRGDSAPDQALASGFRLLPIFLAVAFGIFLLAFRRHAKATNTKF